MRQGPAPAMTSASSARAKRDEAAHARRLAAMLFPLDADRLPLLHHAEDLEQQAEALDRQAASAARPGPIEQRQVEQRQVEQRQAEQQPQEGEAAADDKRPSPRRKPD